MNISVSYTCNKKIKGKMFLKKKLVKEILEDVVLFILEDDFVINSLNLKKLLKKDIKEVDVSLYICDNAEIQVLNFEYRGVNAPTDVLSFVMTEIAMGIDLPIFHLGEVIISIDKLLEQASNNKHSNLQEFVFLVSHGILHLLGMHHATEQDYDDVINIQNMVVDYILEKYY